MNELVTQLNFFLNAGGWHLFLLDRNNFIINLYQIDSTNKVEISDSIGSYTFPIYHIQPGLIEEFDLQGLAGSADYNGDIILISSNVKDGGDRIMVQAVNDAPDLFNPIEDEKAALEDRYKALIHHEAVHILLERRFPGLLTNIEWYNLNWQLPLGDDQTHLDMRASTRMLSELCATGAEIEHADESAAYVHSQKLQPEQIDPNNPYHLAFMSMVYISINLAGDSELKSRVAASLKPGGPQFSSEDFYRLINKGPNGESYHQAVGQEMFSSCYQLLDSIHRSGVNGLQ